MEQLFKIVDKDQTQIRWQSEWIGDFWHNFLFLSKKTSLSSLMNRSFIRARMQREKNISLSEMIYPLLQAYDSVAVESDIEFSGADQRFNLLMGREVQPLFGQQPQNCIIVSLLTGTHGSDKMSKSLNNHININMHPNDMFIKIMGIKDSLMDQYFELLTDIRVSSLDKNNPMLSKKKLAHDIVRQLFGDTKANFAQDNFEIVIQNKEMPKDIITISWMPDTKISQFIKNIQFAKSLSDARRLINQHAVRIDGEYVDSDILIDKRDVLLQVGKHKVARVV